MRVSHLALDDYRSYRQLVVELPGGPVVFKGRNGRGKTNLVESIAYLSTFASHRVSADRALLRVPAAELSSGEDPPTAAVIRARVGFGSAEASRTKLLELEIVQGKANRARLNRAQVQPSSIVGSLRTVMFAPEDLQLLRGDPGGRRRFLDELVLQLKPSFLGTRRDFEKTLRQRGAVLKQLGRFAQEESADLQLAPWDEALARLSAQVAAHRMSVVHSLSPLLEKYYAQVSEEDKPVSFTYGSHVLQSGDTAGNQGELPAIPAVEDGFFPDLSPLVTELEARYANAIVSKRSDELRRGNNLVGAHLDDFASTLAGLPVKGYASQGETWSYVLSLRLASMDLLTADGDTPVLILDDVFSELDVLRRKALADCIADVEQVLITTAVFGDVPPVLEPSVFEVTFSGVDGSVVYAVASGDALVAQTDDVVPIGGKEVNEDG